jgi:hypothetical protein
MRSVSRAVRATRWRSEAIDLPGQGTSGRAAALARPHDEHRGRLVEEDRAYFVMPRSVTSSAIPDAILEGNRATAHTLYAQDTRTVVPNASAAHATTAGHSYE